MTQAFFFAFFIFIYCNTFQLPISYKSFCTVIEIVVSEYNKLHARPTTSWEQNSIFPMKFFICFLNTRDKIYLFALFSNIDELHKNSLLNTSTCIMTFRCKKQKSNKLFKTLKLKIWHEKHKTTVFKMSFKKS